MSASVTQDGHNNHSVFLQVYEFANCFYMYVMYPPGVRVASYSVKGCAAGCLKQRAIAFWKRPVIHHCAAAVDRVYFRP